MNRFLSILQIIGIVTTAATLLVVIVWAAASWIDFL